MKFPSWAPLELIDLHSDLQKEVAKDKSRAIKKYDPRKALEDGWLYVGDYYLGGSSRLAILEPLIANPAMKEVWAALYRRTSKFKPANTFPYGQQTQAHNLVGVCFTGEFRWLNLPRRTRTEAKRFYTKIANHAAALADLLLKDPQNKALLAMSTLVPPQRIEKFREALIADHHSDWYGFDGWLNMEIFETLLEPLPAYVLTVETRAKTLAAKPPAVKQPKSKTAKMNFFLELLSEYFTKAYGSPLHAHVATIVSAIFHAEVDEDRVRAFLRSRKKAYMQERKGSG